VPTLQALGKDFFIFLNFFAECQVFIFFYKISLPSANLQALGKDF
jgi:hypothetical protein